MLTAGACLNTLLLLNAHSVASYLKALKFIMLIMIAATMRRRI